MVVPNLSRRELLGLGIPAVSLVSFSACATIPFGGSVNHYADTPTNSPSSGSNFSPEGPSEGASPEEIIKGFLRAGIGSDNDYEIARQYLNDEAAQSWRADSQTLVYSDSLSISSVDTGDYSVAVPATTQVNASGIATSYAETSDQNLIFSLEQVDGQWRISSLPNGLVLEQSEFEQSFSPFTLYFYDPTFTYAIPDIRWFADRTSVSTSLVKVLAEGPAPYLTDAVKNAIPSGSSLTRNSVPVDGTEAQVSLTGDNLTSDTSQLEIERIHTQLTQTLTRLTGIDSVRLSFGNETIATGQLQNFIAPQVNPAVPKNVVAVDGSQLTLRNEILTEDSISTVLGIAQETVSALAMAYNRQYFAYLNSNHSSLSLVHNSESHTVLEGENLTTPSFDQFQWLWCADSSGAVHTTSFASGSDGEVSDISADWLRGAKVTSLRISRDGSRAALVAESSESTYLWISGVMRDSDNRPTGLNEPVRVGTSLEIQHAVWINDQALIASNFDTGESELAYLSGELSQIDQLDGLTAVSSCIGGEQILAQTGNQNIYLLVDRGWSRIETSAHEINYSC